MAGRRGRSRGSRSTRGPKNQTWTVVAASNQTFDNTPTVEELIVIGSDWTANASGTERGTLLRMRGWLSVAMPSQTTAQQSVFAAIYIAASDSPVAATPPDDSGFYDLDVLWTGGVFLPGGEATSVEPPRPHSWEIDVKAMRRLTSEQEVRLALIGTGTAVVSYSTIIRALMRRGGN